MAQTSILVLPVRILQLVLSIVILGLSGYVANWYNVDTLTSSPPQVNFLIFCPLWSAITIVYAEVVPRFYSRISHPYPTIAFDALNIVFYLSGMIALAVFLNGLLFCRGTVCGAARADTGLAGVQCLLFSASTILVGKEHLKPSVRKTTRGRLQGAYPKDMMENSVA